MSDEKEDKVMKAFLRVMKNDLSLRVEKLEAQMDKYLDDILGNVPLLGAFEKLTERVEKLEVDKKEIKSAIKQISCKDHFDLEDVIDDVKKEVAELRESIGTINKMDCRLSGRSIKNKVEINELKEVVRELISAFEMENMVETGLLEKLEGQKPFIPHKCELDPECVMYYIGCMEKCSLVEKEPEPSYEEQLIEDQKKVIDNLERWVFQMRLEWVKKSEVLTDLHERCCNCDIGYCMKESCVIYDLEKKYGGAEK